MRADNATLPSQLLDRRQGMGACEDRRKVKTDMHNGICGEGQMQSSDVAKALVKEGYRLKSHSELDRYEVLTRRRRHIRQETLGRVLIWV